MDKAKIKEFFDRLSQSWDEQLETDKTKIDEILDSACVSEGKRILDIACGTGVMFDFYLERGISGITGVDLSGGMLRAAEQKFGGNEKIALIQADADSFDFKSEYDCCMVFNAFPHFAEPEKLINNLKSALKNGGVLCIAHDWGRKELDSHHKKEASEVSRGLMSSDELAALFEKCGFKNVFKKENEGIYIVSGVKD